MPRSLPEEDWAEIGAVNLRMAHDARLILDALVVARTNGPSSSRPHVGRMTTQAKEIHVIDLQHPGIGGAVRSVARQAAFVCLYRRVFENEWSHGVGMALGADGELPGSSADLVADLRAVRIVAVAALHESDINAMAIGAGELGLLRGMAAVAQLRLRLHQHEIHITRLVWTVAGGASDAAGKMSGLGKVLCFKTGLVAFGADAGGLGGSQRLKTNDLGDIAATVDVRLARPVTTLATVLIAFEQRVVWGGCEVLFPYLLMAGLADVVGGVSACGSCLRSHGLIGCLRLSSERRRVRSYEQQEDGKGNPYDPCTRKLHACLQAEC